MSVPADLASSVERLCRAVQLDAAEAQLREWWANADVDALESASATLETIICVNFYKKRKIRLLAELAQALERARLSEQAPGAQLAKPVIASHDRNGTRPSPGPVGSHRPAVVLSSLPQEPMDLSVADDGANASAGTGDEPLVDLLSEVIALNEQVRPKEAAERFREWLAGASDGAISESDDMARSALRSFFRKWNAVLTEEYVQRKAELARESAPDAPDGSTLRPMHELNGAIPAPHAVAIDSILVASPAASGAADRVGTTASPPPTAGWDYTRRKFDDDLAELSARHIFQWNTYYRDSVGEYFDEFVTLVDADGGDGPRATEVTNYIADRFRQHAQEIFHKGYEYVRTHNDPKVEIKSENGLQRFLDLPLEVYSAKLASLREGAPASSLRPVTSAMLSGILRGFSMARLGDRLSLPSLHRVWVRVLPFLSRRDIEALLEDMPLGPIRRGIRDSVVPFAEVIDEFAEQALVPKLSEYTANQRKITVSLQPPQTAGMARLLEIHVFLSESDADKEAMDSAVSRAVTAVLGPFTPDLRAYIASTDQHSAIAVPTIVDEQENASARFRAILRAALSDKGGKPAGQLPIDYNYAKLFPLTNPQLAAYNHVYRGSVRRLMQRFDRSNGVRLWCSVRRSGKTTASAADLGSTSENAVVVNETCARTGTHAGTNYLYSAVKGALDSGIRLPDDFLVQTLSQARGRSTSADRMVFILDEYERLFRDLRTALAADTGSGSKIVQPLLDQMVEFSEENLIVFLGQQPDAHYILMAHNQLSAYVEQDQFPLFPHDPEDYRSEFHELLRNILTSYVDYDLSFANAVYGETGGHPFLTVNLLVALMDWLIAERRPRSVLQGGMTRDLFDEFAAANLTPRGVARREEFKFFRRAASDALTANGRSIDPWLYSVYASLRTASLHSGEADFAIGDDDFVELIRSERATGQIAPDEVLGTACQANFLKSTNGVVRPRIKILSRIAAAVQRDGYP